MSSHDWHHATQASSPRQGHRAPRLEMQIQAQSEEEGEAGDEPGGG